MHVDAHSCFAILHNSFIFKVDSFVLVPNSILFRSIFREKRPEVKLSRSCNVERIQARKCPKLEEAEIRISFENIC